MTLALSVILMSNRPNVHGQGRVVRVHLAGDVDVAVGVEACGKLVALVPEVGLYGEYGRFRFGWDRVW